MPTCRFAKTVFLFGVLRLFVDCTSDKSGLPAPGPDAASDATVPDGSADGNGGDTGTGSSEDAGADGQWLDAADGAADASPPIFVCGTQVCSAGEFCGTPKNAEAGTADAGSNAVAIEAGAADAGVADDAGAADAGAADAGATDAGATDVNADEATTTPIARCEPATFSNLCDNPSETLIFDQYDADNAAAVEIGTALQSACGMNLVIPAHDDGGVLADAGVLNPVSGEPTTGIGNLCVIGGGSFGQQAVGYLDAKSLTEVYIRGVVDDAGVLDLLFTDRGGPGAPTDVASEPYSATTQNTDYFLLQMSVDPVTGSLCFMTLGITAAGTTAGAYYAANDFIANGDFASSTKSWLVYKWTAAGDAGVVSEQDTFTLIASGP
jgi:hypothetical protein